MGGNSSTKIEREREGGGEKKGDGWRGVVCIDRSVVNRKEIKRKGKEIREERELYTGFNSLFFPNALITDRFRVTDKGV